MEDEDFEVVLETDGREVDMGFDQFALMLTEGWPADGRAWLPEPWAQAGLPAIRRPLRMR